MAIDFSRFSGNQDRDLAAFVAQSVRQDSKEMRA